MLEKYESSVIDAGETDIENSFRNEFDLNQPIEHKHFLVNLIMNNYYHNAKNVCLFTKMNKSISNIFV